MGGLAMKESLFDLFQRHRDCYDYRKDPTIEEQRNQPKARLLMAERISEGKQAAREYASSLIPLGNDWIEAVKHDVEELATTLPPSLRFNKAEREAYRDGVQDFLLNVAAALREYGKGQWLDDLDPKTAYRLGIERGSAKILSELSKDEAVKTSNDMKQHYSQVYCFPDLFSMFPTTYTVLGYKPGASTPAQPPKEADSGTTSTGIDSNAPDNPQKPQKTTKLAIIRPYTPKPVGREPETYIKSIADIYKDKADIIQEHTKKALADMNDPKAVIALFVVYFKKGVVKQCPTYWQTLRLLDIEADENTEKEKLCPFGMHQQYDIQRKKYFDKSNSYRSLNDTDSEQEDEISSFIQDANTIYIGLLAKLIQEPKGQARQDV